MYRIFGNHAIELGEVHFESRGQAFGAVCLGGAPKRYGNSISNEDRLLLASARSGILIAVADAHNGPEASQIALEWLAQHKVKKWTTNSILPEQWFSEAPPSLVEINQRILEFNKHNGLSSRTTLVIGLIQIQSEMAFVASAGDSHAFLVTRTGSKEIAIAPAAGEFFLGARALTLQSVTSVSSIFSTPVNSGDALLLASDGISTEGIGFDQPSEAINSIAQRLLPFNEGRNFSQRMIGEFAEAACRKQQKNDAGDNIAIAITQHLEPTH